MANCKAAKLQVGTLAVYIATGVRCRGVRSVRNKFVPRPTEKQLTTSLDSPGIVGCRFTALAMSAAKRLTAGLKGSGEAVARNCDQLCTVPPTVARSMPLPSAALIACRSRLAGRTRQRDEAERF